MKQIQPLAIWGQGSTKDATILNAYVVNLQLNQSATFYYQLLSEASETLAQGNLTMGGENYQDWEQDEFAWGWVASQLNVTIIGDFVPKSETITEETRMSAEIVEESGLVEEAEI